MTVEGIRQPTRHRSATLVRSGIKGPNDGEWVVMCGYTTSDKFGYFICEEVVQPPYIRYCNAIHFAQRTGEQAYKDILAEFKQRVEKRSFES